MWLIDRRTNMYSNTKTNPLSRRTQRQNTETNPNPGFLYSSLGKSTLHRRTRDREVEGDRHKAEEREEDLVREEDTRSNVCTLKSDLTVLLALNSTLWDTSLFPVLGLVPVRDGPLTAASPLQCGHHVAPRVPRKGKPQRKHPGREAGQRHTEESTKTQNPFLPRLCSPLRGVATLKVLQTLLREVSRLSPGGASGRGLPGDLVHGVPKPEYMQHSIVNRRTNAI